MLLWTTLEYGQACAHLIRLAVPGTTCNPYKDTSWLLLALWATVGFCLICTPDQHTRWGGESWCGVAIPCSYISQNSHGCCLWLRNATRLLSVPQGTQIWQRGWLGTPFPCEPVQNGNQPCCNCVLLQDFRACEQHRHFLWLHFRLSAEEAKSPAPWKETEEHRAKLLVKINSTV